MILIALGANLPGLDGAPPEATLEAAKAEIAARAGRVIQASRTWLTAPVPASDQPWYRNSVIEIETDLSAMDLLSALHEIEMRFGRIRSSPNAPRILDLDLIAYHDQVIDSPRAVIPHPRMHGRGFVLHPLCEIAPEWIHPVMKRSARALLTALEKASVDNPVDTRAA